MISTLSELISGTKAALELAGENYTAAAFAYDAHAESVPDRVSKENLGEITIESTRLYQEKENAQRVVTRLEEALSSLNIAMLYS